MEMWIDLTGEGSAYVSCFERTNIDLPSGYRFGLSAQTTAYESGTIVQSLLPQDDHKVHSMEVYDLGETKKTGESQKITDEFKAVL